MPTRDRAPMPRRALLAGLAASPAVITLAVASMPAMAHPAPTAPRAAVLAEVAELTRLYEAAMRRTAAADAACEAAEERYVRPPEPTALFYRSGDPLLSYVYPVRRHDGRSWYGTEEKIATLRSWPMDLPGWEPQRTRRNEILAAYDRWQADIATAKEVAGLLAADAEYKAAMNEDEKPVRQRILDLRSDEPAALRLKVRAYLSSASTADWREGLDHAVASGIASENGPWEDAMAASILRDVVTAYRQVEA